MFSPVKFLAECSEQLDDLVEKGIIEDSSDFISPDYISKGVEYVKRNTRSDGALTLNGAERWLEDVGFIQKSITDRLNYAPEEKTVKQESLEAINKALQYLDFSTYVEQFNHLGCRMNDVIKIYEMLLSEVHNFITGIVVARDGGIIKSFTDNALNFISTIDRSFSKALTDAYAGKLRNVKTDDAVVNNCEADVLPKSADQH